jgi:HAD superfamily hydrolase (TIGR01490 family)
VPRPLPLTLFDLDHTLLDGDSDVLWCEFLMQRGVLERARFEPRNAQMERDYRAGTVGTEAFSAFYVSTLAGRTPRQWEPLRRAFLDEVVAPRIGGAARALVDQHRRAGALVLLTTATNRFITELTAVHLGIEHLVATECEFDDQGRFTGRPQGTLNMRAGKVVRLHAWLAERGQALAHFESWAYSDSINDLPLLSAVDHAVVVHADERLAGEAAGRGWPALHLHGPQAPSAQAGRPDGT